MLGLVDCRAFDMEGAIFDDELCSSENLCGLSFGSLMRALKMPLSSRLDGKDGQYSGVKRQWLWRVVTSTLRYSGLLRLVDARGRNTVLALSKSPC